MLYQENDDEPEVVYVELVLDHHVSMDEGGTGSSGIIRPLFYV